ncbi:MAG: CocE/NonD family hydrolase [Candidatus Sphingomonas phytovorans]|nr:CocE/NonD family hydrolase [Sphingomonas sp.]WEK00857.1 MAG: CocE/NonD family hydrolase [Sphingomonas sp.]
MTRTNHFLLTAALAAGAIIGPGAGAAQSVPTSTPARPDGWSDKSYYLPMRDGVRLAISLYFPGGVPPEKPAPVMLIQTRYGRAGEADFGSAWRRAGYVVAIADTRGSTASFGARRVDIGPEEQRDMDEIIAHLAHQPWSNGQVIASGVSYMADTADLATSRPAPALLAAIPRQTDFDTYLHLFSPGGVSNDWMLRNWGNAVREMDMGRDPEGGDADCLKQVADCARLFPILQPVDGDENFDLLRQALATRGLHWSPEDYEGIAFRDEPGRNSHTLFASSPAAQLAAIRRQRKPVQYWGSWLDAGMAEAALARYRSAPEVPAEVWITANNHGQSIGADPFFPSERTPIPAATDIFASNIAFADRVRAGARIERAIHYYVMGAKEFRTTAAWPPADTKSATLYFAPGRSLAPRAPGRRGADRYTVDFTATTGKATRWSTQFGTPPAYPDRRKQDARLLTYNSSPMDIDTELVGTPVVTLHMAARTSDPAVFVYLEDVAPDGRSTYLGEGQFRAIHRKPADPATLPYDQGPAPHSFRRADALAVTPGARMTLRFALFPTAALIRRGHRLRVAIAGADADTFHVYSNGGPDTFTISYGAGAPSGLEITTRPWKPS